MKIYLDTNIISTIVNKIGFNRLDINEAEYEALSSVILGSISSGMKFCTSKIAGEEIDKIPTQYREMHSLLFQLLPQLEFVPEHRTNSNLLLLGVGGGSVPDPLLLKLSIKFGNEDARHIFQAIKNEADVFLTSDTKITKNSCELIKLLKPSQLIKLL